MPAIDAEEAAVDIDVPTAIEGVDASLDEGAGGAQVDVSVDTGFEGVEPASLADVLQTDVSGQVPSVGAGASVEGPGADVDVDVVMPAAGLDVAVEGVDAEGGGER